jgi:hypothetical protein
MGTGWENKKENNHVGWPFYTGIIVCIAGIIFVVARKNSAGIVTKTTATTKYNIHLKIKYYEK